MDNAYIGYRSLLLLFLTAVNAFFSAAEVSLLSVRPSKMQALAAQGNIGAQAAMTLINNMERMISLSQVGITIASLGMGWAGEEAMYAYLVHVLQPISTPQTEIVIHGLSFVFSFLLLTFVLVVLGEVVPKNLAVEKAERMAVLTSPALLVCYRMLEPFVYVVERSSAFVSRLFGLKGISPGGAHSAEEIKHIVSISGTEGHLPLFEQKAIHHLLDLRLLVAREVMVPRGSVVSVPIDAPLDVVLQTMAEHAYSRVPVYQDHPENIVGVIHSRELIRIWHDYRAAGEHAASLPPFRLVDWMHKPLVVPETKPLNALIDQFRLAHQHMATVVDEFGTITGLITMEDVFEQVFGEIEDENDIRQPHKDESDLIEVEGTIPIRDLEMQFGIEVPFEDSFETLAGFLLSRFGFIPKGGEQVAEAGRRFTVLAMDRNRIARVRIERLEPETGSALSQRGPITA